MSKITAVILGYLDAIELDTTNEVIERTEVIKILNRIKQEVDKSEAEMTQKLKEPNFYIVNLLKNLNKDNLTSISQKIQQLLLDIKPKKLN